MFSAYFKYFSNTWPNIHQIPQFNFTGTTSMNTKFYEITSIPSHSAFPIAQIQSLIHDTRDFHSANLLRRGTRLSHFDVINFGKSPIEIMETHIYAFSDRRPPFSIRIPSNKALDRADWLTLVGVGGCPPDVWWWKLPDTVSSCDCNLNRYIL